MDEDEFYCGPVMALEIALGNAGIILSDAQVIDLAQSLVDIGADFNA